MLRILHKNTLKKLLLNLILIGITALTGLAQSDLDKIPIADLVNYDDRQVSWHAESMLGERIDTEYFQFFLEAAGLEIINDQIIYSEENKLYIKDGWVYKCESTITDLRFLDDLIIKEGNLGLYKESLKNPDRGFMQAKIKSPYKGMVGYECEKELTSNVILKASLFISTKADYYEPWIGTFELSAPMPVSSLISEYPFKEQYRKGLEKIKSAKIQVETLERKGWKYVGFAQCKVGDDQYPDEVYQSWWGKSLFKKFPDMKEGFSISDGLNVSYYNEYTEPNNNSIDNPFSKAQNPYLRLYYFKPGDYSTPLLINNSRFCWYNGYQPYFNTKTFEVKSLDKRTYDNGSYSIGTKIREVKFKKNHTYHFWSDDIQYLTDTYVTMDGSEFTGRTISLMDNLIQGKKYKYVQLNFNSKYDMDVTFRILGKEGFSIPRIYLATPPLESPIQDNLLERASELKKNERYEEAINQYTKFIISERNGNSTNTGKIRMPYYKLLASALYDRGICYRNLGQYEDAISSLEQAAHIVTVAEDTVNISTYQKGLGLAYLRNGKYELAETSALIALENDKLLNDSDREARGLNLLANIYFEQGKYEKALPLMLDAKNLNVNSGNKSGLFTRNNFLGALYGEMGQFEKSIAAYADAEALANELNSTEDLAVVNANVGMIHEKMNQFDLAKLKLSKALNLYSQLSTKKDIAVIYNNIGLVNNKMKNFDTAKAHFETGLNLCGDDRQVKALILQNLGGNYLDQGLLMEAEKYLLQSAAIYENLQNDVSLKSALDYKDSYFFGLRSLLSVYIRQENIEKALALINQSRSTSSSPLKSIEINSIQQNLDDDEAMLILHLTANDKLGIILIENDKNTMLELSIVDWQKAELSNIDASLNETIEKDQPRFEWEPEFTYNKYRNPSISALGWFLRQQLNNPRSQDNRGFIKTKQGSSSTSLSNLTSAFYKLLIEPVVENLTDKKVIHLYADDILALLPVEALHDGNQYLAEKYAFKLIPSLSIWEGLQKSETHSYSLDFLGIGNPSYSEQSNSWPSFTDRTQFLYSLNQIERASQRGENLGQWYDRLGLDTWSQLPGTQTELEKIAALADQSILTTCDRASESQVKSLSKDKSLTKSRFLHFACHGIAFQSIPELSSLVLLDGDGEDGYLRSTEIENLNINAEVVTLSACESGVGKITGAQGVVGINQSFLKAGAKGVNMSLWPVSDEATALMMSEVYSLVFEQKMSYLEALSTTKRNFISGKFGEAFKHPYYWSAFVYFGN